MSINLFIKTDEQKLWLDKLEQIRPIINATAQIVDEQNSFPHVSIKALKSIGYTKVTLPTQYGGEGFSIYDAVLVQEKLGSFDGSTALIAVWHLKKI